MGIKKQWLISIGLIIFLALAVCLFYQSPIRTFTLRQYLKPLWYGAERDIAAAYEAWTKEPRFALTVPFHHQEYSLSCEIAALKMALDYYGVNASETELIAQLKFDPTPKNAAQNTWGDPQVGFVGRIDGKMPLTGYGVYEDPIVAVANNYRAAEKLASSTLPDLISAVSNGHPVVVWGSINAGYDISWQTPSRKKIKAVTGEHARVFTGWVGATSSPSHLLLVDPVYGQIQLSQTAFLKDWALLDNKAVVVY